MLKSAKVFGVRVREKESEARKSSESCDMSHDHDQTKTLGPDWPGNRPVNQAIWVDQSASKDAAALEIRTSRHDPNLPRQMKRKHRLAFLRSIQGYTRTTKAKVNTLYKRKADKVHPVNYSGPSGDTPGGFEDWPERCLQQYHASPAWDKPSRFDKHLHPRIATFPRGTRLSPDRAERMMVGSELTPEENDLLLEILFKREGALAWGFEDVGRVRPEVAPPQRMRTLPHEAWQIPGFKVPRALRDTVDTMLKQRMQVGILERGHGSYRNPWFLVKKKGKDAYRLINAAIYPNKVTIRDANMPPDADEFVEEFSGMAVASLIDLFSGYDQITLDEKDRDMTAIHTPLGLLRQTTLLQGASNSVAQFVRIISKILEPISPNAARVFLDDIGVKGPKTKYDGTKISPGLRQYIFEHLINLEKTLWFLELAGATIAAEKSQFVMAGLKIVGWVCDYDGRHPDEVKIAKVLDWPVPVNVPELRGFVGLAVYFRVLIDKFQWIMEPLYRPLRKGTKFFWGLDQQKAFDKIKSILTTFPVVMPIDYNVNPLQIIVAVDASVLGWGAVLLQNHRGKRHPARYESGVWNESEKAYDAGKRECRAVLKAFKKFRHWLYGVHFTLEIDANTLVAQLNRTATDLPGALVTSWLAWIQLFDFSIKHVPGTKHLAADALSRRPATDQELEAQRHNPDIDDFVQASIGNIQARVSPIDVDQDVTPPRILHESYSDESEQLALYLSTLQRPRGISKHQFNTLKRRAKSFVIEGDLLFRRASKNVPLRRVVDDTETKQAIIRNLHDETGHKGRDGTTNRIATRYWWQGLYNDVTNYCRTCFACQARDPSREEESLHPTWTSTLWEKVELDIMHMPSERGYNYFALARESTSLWVEGAPIRTANAETIAKFLYENIICRYGCPRQIVKDGGPENQGVMNALVEKYGIHRLDISPYHPPANGGIERSNRTFKESLSKLNNGTARGWTRHWAAVLFADRTTAKRPTGMTPYRILFGQEAVFPIELEVPTWATQAWDRVLSTGDLLLARARQIERRDHDMEEAVERLKRMRMENKDYFDSLHQIRFEPLKENDMVLLHNTVKNADLSSSNTLRFRWLGPYRVHRDNGNGSYIIKELDGTVLSDSTAGNRLKRFHPRSPSTDNQFLSTDNEDNEDNGDNADSPAPNNESSQQDDDASLIPDGWDFAVIV